MRRVDLSLREQRLCSLNGRFWGFMAFILIIIVGLIICGGLSAKYGRQKAALILGGIVVFALLIWIIIAARWEGYGEGNPNLRGVFALFFCWLAGVFAVSSFSEGMPKKELIIGGVAGVVIGWIIWAVIVAAHHNIPPPTKEE